MNSKNKRAVILLSLICGVFLYCCLILNNQLTEVKNSLSKMEKNTISAADLLCYSNHIAELVFQFHKFKNQNEADSIFGQTPVLIYRYSQFICNDCIQMDLDALHSLQNEIGKEHVWILPAYDDTRNNRIKLLNMLHKFHYRLIPDDDFPMPADCDGDGLNRFFAIINKDGSMGMIFFPEASKPQLIKNYFSEIKKKFKNAE